MNHRLESLGAVEAIGTASDQSGLVVQTLSEAVGLSAGDIGEDPVFVPLDGLREFDERRGTRASGPREPLSECFLRSAEFQVVECLGKRLLEQIGAVERPVVLLDGAQAQPLHSGEVPRVLQQRETRVLDPASLVGALRIAHLFAPHFVDGVAGEPLDLEAVEDDLRLRRAILQDGDVGLRHVDRRGRDPRAPVRTQLREEALQCVRTLAFAGPHDPPPRVVDHDRDVVVVPTKRDLVDANHVQVLQSLRIEPLLDDPRHDRADAPPVDAHQQPHRRLIHPLGEIGRHLLELLREARSVRRPRHLFHRDPAARALDTLRSVLQPERPATQGEVTPSARRAAVIARTAATAPAAPGLVRPRPEVDHHSLVNQFQVLDDDVDDTEQIPNYCIQAHGGGPHL